MIAERSKDRQPAPVTDIDAALSHLDDAIGELWGSRHLGAGNSIWLAAIGLRRARRRLLQLDRNQRRRVERRAAAP